MKSWEVIADNLSKAGWSWGYVSALDSQGRTIWIADAHRDGGSRFVVHGDEKLSAFDYAPEPRMLPLTPRPEDPAVSRTGPSDRPRNMPPT